MPFTLDPEIVAGLVSRLNGTDPPPPLAVGDVKGRKERVEAHFAHQRQTMPAVPDVDTKDFHTKAEDGHEVLCRWYTKRGSTPPGSAVCYTHGGGMIALSVAYYDHIVKRYVTRTGVPFMVVEYRLAPDFKAPTPVTDAYAGLQCLHAHAHELGVDPNRIAIMGDSAGGGIAASLAHYTKLKGGPTVCKQILIYPMLDDRHTEVDPNIAPFLTWSADDNKTAWGALLGDRMGGNNVHPTEAAARMTVQDARGLPPAYIDIGELDYFRNEVIEYVMKLGQAGVGCEFHLYPGTPHGFEGFAPESSITRIAMNNREKALSSI